MDMLRIDLPEKVKRVIETLQQHGFEAYAVGGCVRDSILGRMPEDWDITTSAQPEEVKALFHRTIDTGIQHGTVTVRMSGESFEVTTYRVDGEYEDGRHPKEVTFTSRLEEDLQRRDFTINAMAYNERDGLIDVFGGIEDLESGVIRCVGNPEERFSEDALRILRGVRFAAQLGFALDEATREGMRNLAPTLKKISAERIQVELVKMLVSDRPELLEEACELGITAWFLPEFDRMMETEQETPHHMYNVGEHTLHAMKNIRRDKVLRLTMLLHDMGKPALKTMDSAGRAHFKKHAAESEVLARQILRRLKFDNDTVKKVTRLVCYHDYRMEATPKNVRRAMNRIGVELFPYYLAVRMADAKAQSPYRRREKIENIIAVRELYQEALIKDECVTLRQLAVSGRDLMELGMRPGRELGSMLSELLEYVIDDPQRNTKENLCTYVKEKLGL